MFHVYSSRINICMVFCGDLDIHLIHLNRPFFCHFFRYVNDFFMSVYMWCRCRHLPLFLVVQSLDLAGRMLFAEQPTYRYLWIFNYYEWLFCRTTQSNKKITLAISLRLLHKKNELRALNDSPIRTPMCKRC